MRDPMSWSIPVMRAFGIQVRVHIFFFIITLGLFLRTVLDKGNVVWWADVLLFTVVMLFGTILLHEFGHCFGGRWVGGEATEILIWPLGGLAFVDVPQVPRAHIIMVAAGPAVNVALALAMGIVLLSAGYLPNANPISNPYVAEIKNYRDGRTYTSPYGFNVYKAGTADPVEPKAAYQVGKPTETKDSLQQAGQEWAVAPPWIVWAQRWFWLNWVLLLFNLLPAYPLDGGQLLQGFIWSRTDYRRGITVAAYSGYIVAVLFLVAAIAVNEALLLGLGLFMFYCSSMRLHSMDAEEGLYGDFSQGYTSLERDDLPPPPPKRPNFIRRWLQARAARRLQREIEQRQMEDERMDQLLDKIAKFGKDSLTDEERRFMERVSARYRNK